MCTDCRVMAIDHILDYMVLCDMPLDIAIRLERDSTIQHALKDRSGEDALQIALDLSETITNAGEELRMTRDLLPKSWEALLTRVRADHVAGKR